MKIETGLALCYDARMTDPATEKNALRQQMLTKRQAVAPGERLRMAQSIKLHFADHPHLTYAQSFAGYYAMRGELDVLPIFNHMQRFHKVMALPRMLPQRQLRFYQWQPGEPLEEGAYGVKQPPETATECVPEVVLVPLLAFDTRGFRLGYGGGYYDRLMQTMRTQTETKPPLFIGVAMSLQEIPDVPTEPHDAPLDGVLTEMGVSLFTSATR